MIFGGNAISLTSKSSLLEMLHENSFLDKPTMIFLLLITMFQMNFKMYEKRANNSKVKKTCLLGWNSLAWWDASDKWKELYGFSIRHKLGVNGGRTGHHLGNGLLDWQTTLRKQADPEYFLCELEILKQWQTNWLK